MATIIAEQMLRPASRGDDTRKRVSCATPSLPVKRVCVSTDSRVRKTITKATMPAKGRGRKEVKKRTPRKSKAHASESAQFKVGQLWEFHALRDFKVAAGVEQVLVEWSGGSVTWHVRSSLESDDAREQLALIASWHYSGRFGTYADYRRAYYGQPVYSAGESDLCGFAAVKLAFSLLGYEWVTDKLGSSYIEAGKTRGKHYDEGMTWPQLFGFIKFMSRQLGKSKAHANLKRIKKNLRSGSEVGREGVKKLTSTLGVYLAFFLRAHIGHVVVVHTRRGREPIVIDDTGAFDLGENKWMDLGSQLTRVHEIMTA